MKYKHLFGPVMSRRLGRSLGIDLVPYKYCPLNCVYCEVQRTTNLVVKRERFFPTDEILDELDSFLKTKPELDYVTFSGAGEPTLNSSLGAIIAHIKVHYPGYKLALLTNGILLNNEEVRSEASVCDVVLPSLDSATQAGFERINRPFKGLRVEDLISGLEQFRKRYKGLMWLEIFLISGINDTPEELSALCNALQRINPDLVQLNSLDRPGTEDWVQPLKVEELKRVKSFLADRISLPVEIIARVKYNTTTNKWDEELSDLLHNTLTRRPSTAEDLAAMLDIHINEISKVLRELHLDGKVSVKRGERGIFYSWT